MKHRDLTDPFSRRTLLKTGLAAAAGLKVMTSSRSAYARPVTYTGLKTDRYLGQVNVETTISDEAVFTEGPAMDRAGHLFFTNVAMSKILRWDPRAKRLSVFRENSNKTNGLLFDRKGRLLCCEGEAGRVTRTDMKTGKTEVLADQFNGFPFAAPNDLCLDDTGHLYFTSRPGTNDPSKGNPNAVYRIDLEPKRSGQHVHQLLRPPEIQMPNGIVTSPDNKTLYVIETHPAADHRRDIRAYDLADDGSIRNQRVLIEFYPGRSGDGMCIDAEGNLYVAAGLHKTRGTSETLDTKPGIHVISPQGLLIGFRETPEDTLTNCTFGGEDLRTLYVTCGTKLLSLRTEIPGKPSYRPVA